MNRGRSTAACGLAVCVVLTGCQRADDAPNFTSFKSAAGRFSVLLPGQPKEDVLPVTIGPIHTEAHMFHVEMNNDQQSYAVSYNDYMTASGAPAEMDPERTLNGARDGMVANVHGSLSKETRISLAGNPGRELTINLGPGTMQSRLYLVKNRLYQLEAAGTGAGVPASAAASFFNSFQLRGE